MRNEYRPFNNHAILEEPPRNDKTFEAYNAVTGVVLKVGTHRQVLSFAVMEDVFLREVDAVEPVESVNDHFELQLEPLGTE